MIAITVKWPVKAEYADQWPELTREFTASTRAEAGCLWFEWARSVEEPETYLLSEAFRDGAAGDHVNSEHFQQAMQTLGRYTAARPKIVSVEAPGDGWSELGELQL